MQQRNYTSNGIIIKRLENRFLLKARGKDEHAMLCGKWQTMNRQAKVIIFKYDCSYAYGYLGASFFLVTLLKQNTVTQGVIIFKIN